MQNWISPSTVRTKKRNTNHKAKAFDLRGVKKWKNHDYSWYQDDKGFFPLDDHIAATG